MAVVTVGSDIIVAGGFGGDFTSDTRTTAAVWRYGAATSTWTPGPALATAGAAFAWALLGTNLHVASGLGPDGATDVDVHYVWDIAGPATWTMAARFPLPATTAVARPPEACSTLSPAVPAGTRSRARCRS